MSTSTTEPDRAAAPEPAADAPVSMDPTPADPAPGDPTPAVSPPRVAMRRRVRGRVGRRARLEIHRFDTFTVLKFSAVWSVAVMIVTLVAVTVLYWVLNSIGVLDSLEQALVDITADAEGVSPLTGLLDFGTILGFSMLSSFVFVICMTAVLTLTAILYNAAADLMGGIGVTLTDRA